MTLDEAISHALDVAWSCEEQAKQCDSDDRYECHVMHENAKCAADHRQLAEWLTELKEAKRLLKMAVEDFKEINSDILTCKYCRWYSAETEECTYCPDDVPCENICGWKHEAEVLKLLGEKEGD